MATKTEGHELNIDSEISVDHSSSPQLSPSKSDGLDDSILAIFVVRFDTQKGNLVEWKLPEEEDLQSIEFKAMASGLHNVTSDIIYFKFGTEGNFKFGISSFFKQRVDNPLERGVRLRSVGVLCTSYSNLHIHIKFLDEQVRQQCSNPGNYSDLISYYEAHSIQKVQNEIALVPSSVEEKMEILHQSGAFSQFVQYFGANVFVLWKAMLLKKRILFVSHPPIGVICYRVYCACLLSRHPNPYVFDTQPNPLFFVNVADIEKLCNLSNFVACTTEAIFSDKSKLYDVYVNNQDIEIKDPQMAQLLSLTEADNQRWSILQSHFHAIRASIPPASFEASLKAIFTQMNEKLFNSLVIESKKGSVVTKGSLNLDSPLDFAETDFYNALAELYGIDILFDDSCCCCCSGPC